MYYCDKKNVFHPYFTKNWQKLKKHVPGTKWQKEPYKCQFRFIKDIFLYLNKVHRIEQFPQITSPGKECELTFPRSKNKNDGVGKREDETVSGRTVQEDQQ